jgi:hypothetical protein
VTTEPTPDDVMGPAGDDPGTEALGAVYEAHGLLIRNLATEWVTADHNPEDRQPGRDPVYIWDGSTVELGQWNNPYPGVIPAYPNGYWTYASGERWGDVVEPKAWASLEYPAPPKTGDRAVSS